MLADGDDLSLDSSAEKHRTRDHSPTSSEKSPREDGCRINENLSEHGLNQGGEKPHPNSKRNEQAQLRRTESRPILNWISGATILHIRPSNTHLGS